VTDNTEAWQRYIDQRKAVPLSEAEIAGEADCPPQDKVEPRRQYIAKRLQEGRRAEDIGAEPDCPAAVVIDFKLRRGVTFSDGSPFTADDVVFTYDWIENPKVDAPRDRQALNRIKGVQKINDYEVAVTFKEPYFLGLLSLGGEGIMSKKFYSAYTPEQFNNSVGLLIGTGPYRMANPTDWKPNPGKIELIRNERYWGLSPSFDRLVYYQIESDAASIVMYGNGELDALALQPQQYQMELKNKPVMDRSRALVYSSPLSGYYFIGWNQLRNGKPTIFADRRVRQAMTLLTDRQGMCDSIFLGYAEPAPGPWHAESKQHDPTLVDWKYDPARAKALLKEVGFEDRGKGVLQRKDGTSLSFKITYPSKNETTDRMMQFVKDNYARAGIAVELDPVDWTIIDQRTKARDFDALVMGWGAGFVEDDIYQMFDSSQIQDQGDNFVSYASPELDAAIRQARRTLDEAKRMELWHRCERILHDDQPYTFLAVNKMLVLFDKRIENVHLAKTGLNVVMDWSMPIPWYVPSALQKYKR